MRMLKTSHDSIILKIVMDLSRVKSETSKASKASPKRPMRRYIPRRGTYWLAREMRAKGYASIGDICFMFTEDADFFGTLVDFLLTEAEKNHISWTTPKMQSIEGVGSKQGWFLYLNEEEAIKKIKEVFYKKDGSLNEVKILVEKARVGGRSWFFKPLAWLRETNLKGEVR